MYILNLSIWVTLCLFQSLMDCLYNCMSSGCIRWAHSKISLGNHLSNMYRVTSCERRIWCAWLHWYSGVIKSILVSINTYWGHQKFSHIKDSLLIVNSVQTLSYYIHHINTGCIKKLQILEAVSSQQDKDKSSYKRLFANP